MAKKPRLFRASSFRKIKPGQPGYKSPTADQFRILRGKRAGEVVSNAGRVTLIKGAHPSKLSAERKAGVRGYQSAASEAQVRKQAKTRRLFSRPHEGKWLHPEEIYGTHPFLSKAGTEQRVMLNGRDLAIMQGYRDDVYGRVDKYGITTSPGALQTGDSSALKKYDRLKIYDVDGNRIRPETDAGKLRRWWDGKSIRARNAFERELRQSGEGEQAVAA